MTAWKGGHTHLVVAIAVAHGMGILTLDDRAMLQGNVGKRYTLIYASIHGTDDVCSISARPSTLQQKETSISCCLLSLGTGDVTMLQDKHMSVEALML